MHDASGIWVMPAPGRLGVAASAVLLTPDYLEGRLAFEQNDRNPEKISIHDLLRSATTGARGSDSSLKRVGSRRVRVRCFLTSSSPLVTRPSGCPAIYMRGNAVTILIGLPIPSALKYTVPVIIHLVFMQALVFSGYRVAFRYASSPSVRPRPNYGIDWLTSDGFQLGSSAGWAHQTRGWRVLGLQASSSISQGGQQRDTGPGSGSHPACIYKMLHTYTFVRHHDRQRSRPPTDPSTKTSITSHI